MPFSVGLQAASVALLSAGFPVVFTSAIIILLVIISITSSLQKDAADAPARLPINSLFAIIPFFRRRFDFLNWGFEVTGKSSFQFDLLRNNVIVVSGESARQTFFSAKGLDLTEGFKILSGAIPMVRGVTSDLQTRRISLIHKRLAAVQKNEQLSMLIPVMLEDSRRMMETWGNSGSFDPFDNVYELIFQLTVRSLSCAEISDDPCVVSRLKKLYDTLDVGTTPATVLLPWFPTPAMIRKVWATKEIYDIVNDTLQMLLDSGDEKLVVFIMGLLIAGARATGTTACWMLTFLGGHPEWRDKAKTEVEGLLASYPLASSESLTSQLASISLETWEAQTPVLDSIIRETLRVAQPHTAMRRNLGPEMHIDGQLVPSGAYVVYPFSDVHLNSEIYPDPWKFNPDRQPETKAAYSYVGWGGGTTTCLGQRLARVELKIVTALFLLGFNHCVVDGSGKAVPQPPLPNWNDILLCRPPRGSFSLSYERSTAAL
ncbi:cytochrome P450 [Rhodocollybia butyracea]|uniref:Cytochrome P450 n=1 Tax=Rhodocollybia butyracea TaxID=206335 RepID=A0A9P5PQN5_9AGAR|nr:cytochrome P450 [Rhodocollybia butyracea]